MKKEFIDKRNKKVYDLKKQKRILYNLKQTNKEEIKKYNLSLNKKRRAPLPKQRYTPLCINYFFTFQKLFFLSIRLYVKQIQQT